MLRTRGSLRAGDEVRYYISMSGMGGEVRTIVNIEDTNFRTCTTCSEIGIYLIFTIVLTSPPIADLRTGCMGCSRSANYVGHIEKKKHFDATLI